MSMYWRICTTVQHHAFNMVPAVPTIPAAATLTMVLTSVCMEYELLKAMYDG